jgi:phosphoglycerate kinase
MKFLDQMDIKGKKLLIRVDYNVPLKDGVIQDDNRIRGSIPTLTYALENEAAIIVSSHLGRPKGKRMPELSLSPTAKRLSELLQHEVQMAHDCIGPEVTRLAEALKPGQVLMLENLRFHEQEEKNDPIFSKQLAELADVYVDDAFAVAHRAHASVVGVTEYAKACCGGFLVKKEWEYLGEALADPKSPYVAIFGGAKVSSKLGILNQLLDKADAMIIGGAMANVFLLAQGNTVGKSLVENGLVGEVQNILDKAEKKGVKLHLPVDFVLGESMNSKASAGTCDAENIPDDLMVLDVGPKSVALFEEVLKPVKTVMWNGPMGAFENPAFANGSMSLAKTIANLDNALTICGGGDTDVVIHKAGLTNKFSFISTGGGSFMAFLEGKELPAFKALKKCDRK